MKRVIVLALVALGLTACVPPDTSPTCVKRSGEAILTCDAPAVSR